MGQSTSEHQIKNFWGDENTIYKYDNATNYRIHVEDERYNAEQAAINRDFQSSESQKERDWSEKMQNQQNQFNVDMWNKTNEYNSPSAQLERARAAGINPAFTANQLSDSSASNLESSSAPSSPIPSGSQASIGPAPAMTDPADQSIRRLQAATDIANTALDAIQLPFDIANVKANTTQQTQLAQNLAQQTSLSQLTQTATLDNLVNQNQLLGFQGIKTQADITQARAQTSSIMHKIMQDYLVPATSAVLGKYNLSENAAEFRVSLLERAQEANQIAVQRAAEIKQHNYDLSYAYGTKSIDSFKRGFDITNSQTDKTNNSLGFGLNVGGSVTSSVNAGFKSPFFSAGGDVSTNLHGDVSGKYERTWGLDKYQQEFNTSSNEMSDINNLLNHDLFNKLDALKTLQLIIVDKDAPVSATQKAFKQFNDLLDSMDTNLSIEIQKTAFDNFNKVENINPYPFPQSPFIRP